MVRRLILLIGFLALPSLSSAREGWRGWCEVGNQSVITSGISSTTKVERSFPQCIVTVFVHGGGLATIYNDNNGTQKANPFQANLDGSWIFYADDGRYDIQTSGANFPQPFTYLDVLLCDPFVAGAVCAGATANAHNLLSTTHLDTIPFSPPVRGDVITAQNQTSPSGVNPSWARLPIGTNGQVLMSNGVDVLWGTVGGGGCTPSGAVDTGILTEHPVGQCFDSTHATWNDATASGVANGQILLIGDGTNVATAPAAGNSLKETFVFGDTNTVTGNGASQLGQFLFGSNSTITGCSFCVAFGDFNDLGNNISATSEEYVFGDDNNVNGSFVYLMGDFNSVSGSDLLVVGEGNSLNSNNAGGPAGITNAIVLEETSTMTLGGLNATIVDTQVLGSHDTFTVGQPTGGNTNTLNCLHGVGSTNTFTLTGGLGSTHSIQNVNWVGKSNQFTATGFNINTLIVSGNSNTINATSANLATAGLFGSSLTLGNCSHCYAYGENVSLSTNNTVAIGFSSTAEVAITSGAVALAAHLNQSATGKFAGTCSMVAGTSCTFSLGAAFSGTPVCVVSPVTTVSGSVVAGACSVSSTTVTITASASNSLAWGAIVVGNPN